MNLPLQPIESLRRRLAAAYRQACLSELDALKPGNVHRFSDGHGMTLEDFITSADVSAKPLTEAGLGLGERIYRTVEATRNAVGCNTNLGIVMLCAPLVQALLDETQPSGGLLRDRLRKVLATADATQTQWLFRAIQLAAPAGLGTSDRYDVSETAGVPLLEVMAHAAERDLIARQYSTGYAVLFEEALPRLHCLEKRWQSREWAVTGLYLSLLARYPDTHIQRKQGLYRAVSTSLHAAELDRGLSRAELPQHFQLRLLQADKEFKRKGINPGTSADMTVATLFIAHLESILPAFERKAGFSRDSDSQPKEVGVRS
ncbi:MAG: triphosphoribosyl-dephospho-CoA synthase [Candidatus Thiodiazotropha sp.]|jgi:triphosphoribosyl-dephospho-CoA synthase